MGRSLVERTLWLFCALLAIAGSVSSHDGARLSSLPSLDPIELATDARLAPDSLPGQGATGIPERLVRTIRPVPLQLRLDGDAQDALPDIAIAPGSRASPRRDADLRLVPTAHYQSDRLKRSGAISSFGTSLPPPLGA